LGFAAGACALAADKLKKKIPTVRVPISIRRRGGRKLVLAPDGTSVTAAPVIRHIDNAMVKAIARAFRWRDMLESGAHATITEIAAAENINESYVGRVLRLSLLAPELVEDILAGRQSAEVQLEQLLRRFPIEWPLQRRAFGAEPAAYSPTLERVVEREAPAGRRS
jgi:hypothetical protein